MSTKVKKKKILDVTFIYLKSHYLNQNQILVQKTHIYILLFIIYIYYCYCYSYLFMSMESKQNLRDKLREIAPEFGLDDMFYGSFRRQFGNVTTHLFFFPFSYLTSAPYIYIYQFFALYIEFRHQWCAADVVYGIAALLEAPYYVVKKAIESDIPDLFPDQEEDTAGDVTSTAAVSSTTFWQQSFHIALSALPW